MSFRYSLMWRIAARESPDWSNSVARAQMFLGGLLLGGLFATTYAFAYPEHG